MTGEGSGRGSVGRVAERQARVAEYVLEKGSVGIKDLTDLFGVSLITIHRDLDELERQGLLRKLRGHVTAQPTSRFDSSVRYRLRTATAEKEALARSAAAQVRPGDSVILDESTTALMAARLLPEKSPITVITNFVMAMNELHGLRGVDLIMLGGEYLPALEAFGGAVCEASLSVVRADVVLMSTSAVSDCFALHQDQEIMRGKRAMMNSAKRRILLVDHTKFDKVALHRLAHLSDFDLVIVDAKVSEAQIQELQENEIPFEIASL
ncbi:DeoR family transcriptional regulator [Rubrobacter tropicus]|uniref:DeoR family transcriptional regulator n=1 Tax=Rubrobacter tropicus TaxID=2653851 RepID=A0A6G8Q506_9ACTN|nr:DeoR/GlpR family DNA-binding transcription regulator [Rubrobacter tropicus]QIN81499.1 DeoR family transcriptional regulator [Rubrobacter tropicus]